MIEIIDKNLAPRKISHALFDFDGTISLIREGWQEIMIPMMVHHLGETPTNESEEELTTVVKEYVDMLTGKQTMYQMLRLVEEIEKRGGTPRTAEEYKAEYLDLLEVHIEMRLKNLAEGIEFPHQYLIPGAENFLEALQKAGIVCHLASGTDEAFVRREAKLLKVDHFFHDINGAKQDYQSFSKKIAIETIISDHQISGEELAVFGDGYVEIEVGKEAGALAVGIASDERELGALDTWKRERLIKAGASIIAADFSDPDPILDYLRNS